MAELVENGNADCHGSLPDPEATHSEDAEPAGVTAVPGRGDVPLFAGISDEEVVDWACSDQLARWRRGERVPAEAYFGLHPALAPDGPLVFELVYAEFSLRAELGELPKLEEFQWRFPEHAAALEAQSQFDKAFDAAASGQTFVASTLDAGVVEGLGALDGEARPARSGRIGPGPDIPGYEIEAELGRGGMGVVYRARQLALNRSVALKMILSGDHAGPEATARFLAEAEAVARLQHPQIVQIYAIGSAGGLHYLELEYLPGGSLDRALGGMRRVPLEAARLVEQLARAIAEAHRQGIVHRDLKPGNVLLAADGTPKIADFGLAKALDDPSGLTHTEAILGSPYYMAPEQAEGRARAAGPAADIYSLGAILYELLTGRPPFKGATVIQTLELVRSAEPVPPSRLQPGVPRDLATIVLTCLHKDASRRYADAEALAEDLRRYQAGESILARRPLPAERAWRWCRRKPALAAMAASIATLMFVLMIGTSLAAYWLRQERDAILDQTHRADRADRERRIGLVNAVLTAAPDSVPYILDTLRPSRDQAVPLLRRRLDDRTATRASRLRAGVALSLLGEPKTADIVATVASAAPQECDNIELALAADRDRAVPALRSRADAARNPEVASRFAILLLGLGDPVAARSVLARRADPSRRIALIHGLRSWHGRLELLPKLLRLDPDPSFRSGMALAVGMLDPERLGLDVRSRLLESLQDLYRDDPDGATHAAAGWALRQWRATTPPLEPDPAQTDKRHWFVNNCGMTMIEVPEGFGPMGDAEVRTSIPPHTIVHSRPFFMSDREVTADSFEAFASDPGYPVAHKAAGWPGSSRSVSPTGDCPANNVSWSDALLFCNWLSHREGRTPCYTRHGTSDDDWACDFEADGYRLPTDAEWEYACRGGTATHYPFGDEPDLLGSYSSVTGLRFVPGGQSLPNDWGLFDMLGNCWEWCWEGRALRPPALAIDPVGEAKGPDRVARGGAFGAGPYYCLSAAHFYIAIATRSTTYGFRVVCRTSEHDPTGTLQAARYRRLAEAMAARPGGLADATKFRVAIGRRLVARGALAAAADAFAAAIADAPVDWSPAGARIGLGSETTSDAELAAWDRGFAQAVRAAPGAPGLRAAWARFYYEFGLWDLAAARASDIPLAHSTPARLWRPLPWFALAAGDTAGYRSLCARLAGIVGPDPSSDALLALVEGCSLDLGGSDYPGRLADRMAQSMGDTDDARLAAGLALYRAGRYETAATHLKDAIKRAPKMMSLRPALAMTYHMLGREKDARPLIAEAERGWDGVLQRALDDPEGVGNFKTHQAYARFFALLDATRTLTGRPSARDDPKLRLLQARARLRFGLRDAAAADLAVALEGAAPASVRTLVSAEAARFDSLFNRAVTLRPNDLALRAARGRVLARRGYWRAAADELGKTNGQRKAPADPVEYACVLILAGDASGHRRHVEEMLRSARRKPATVGPALAAWTALLAPQSAEDLSDLFRRLGAGGGKPEAGVRAPLADHVFRLARYRRGDHRGILDAPPRPAPDRRADQLLAALAHYRLGHFNEARHLLAETERLLEADVVAARDSPPSSAAAGIADWLECHVLVREARAQFGADLPDLPRDVFAPQRRPMAAPP